MVIKDSSIHYYILPGGTKAKVRYAAHLESEWRRVVDEFQPDVVHIHGTEYAHALPLVKVCGDIPAVVSLQGLLTGCEPVFYGGMSLLEVLRYRSFRDYVRMDGILEQRWKFRKRARYEQALLKKARHVVGRTDWDRAHVLAINPELQYHTCNESLRHEFYQMKWDLADVERHSVFVSQAFYPIKGFHMLLRALPHVRMRYPDARVYVAGYAITDNSTTVNRLRMSGYARYLRQLIQDFRLHDTVSFVGSLDASAMVKRYAQAHVFVLSSAVENSSNSLAEAMMVGTPCVAAFTGGTPDLLTHGVSGLLYDFNEPIMLAERMCRIFSSDELALTLSKAARAEARTRHSRNTNCERTLAIYSQVVCSSRAQTCN